MFDSHRFLVFLAAAVVLAVTPGPERSNRNEVSCFLRPTHCAGAIDVHNFDELPGKRDRGGACASVSFLIASVLVGLLVRSS
jgi:hypothetical protein